MSDLASAAGFSWHWQAAPAAAIQQITLDVGRLASLYSFVRADSDPRAMVEQWIELRDRQ